MKTLVKIVGLGLVGGLSLSEPTTALANLEVSTSVQIRARTDFDAPLAVHGSWVEVRSHGRCWRPAGVVVGWRPYCNGTWVWTDRGWYWNSDEPWAWACYHYGTWAYDSELGWVWVPDIEWAPAWVYWRVGGGYVGWAPCPPRGVVVAPGFYAFVATSRFQERVRPSTVVINNPTIINETKVIPEATRVNRNIDGIRQDLVLNEGPGVAVIQKATGKEIRAIPVHEAVRQTAFPQSAGRESKPTKDKPPSPSAPGAVQPASAIPESANPVSPDGDPTKKQIDPSSDQRPKEGKDKKSGNKKRKNDEGHNKGKP